jgi:hypothetical protein
MMLVREQDALFLSIPAVETALWLVGVRGQESRIRDQASENASPNTQCAIRNTQPPRLAALPRVIGGWALLAGAAAVVFIPQLLSYHAINGGWGPSRTVASKLTWWSPHFFEVLLSPQYGLLAWTPVVALALLGLIVLARRDPVLAAAFGVAFLAQVFVAGTFLTWMGASSFGQRRFINATVIVAFGLAALAATVAQRGVPRPALAATAALFIAWNGGLEIQYATQWNSAQREQGLPPDVIARQLALPARLPGTLWGLLTNPGQYQNPEGRP